MNWPTISSFGFSGFEYVQYVPKSKPKPKPVVEEPGYFTKRETSLWDMFTIGGGVVAVLTILKWLGVIHAH